jgi:hypothetical protein
MRTFFTSAIITIFATYGRRAGDSVSFNEILTDDCDMLTFDCLTVYTANLTAIKVAHKAGKLQNPGSAASNWL